MMFRFSSTFIQAFVFCKLLKAFDGKSSILPDWIDGSMVKACRRAKYKYLHVPRPKIAFYTVSHNMFLLNDIISWILQGSCLFPLLFGIYVDVYAYYRSVTCSTEDIETLFNDLRYMLASISD